MMGVHADGRSLLFYTPARKILLPSLAFPLCLSQKKVAMRGVWNLGATLIGAALFLLAMYVRLFKYVAGTLYRAGV